MDKLNFEWLNGQVNFYFRYKRQLLESMIEGSCINIGCGSHIIENAVNVDEGLPKLPYADESFDTVICSDVLEHLGPHKQAVVELLRIARKRVIITVPAGKWLYGEYDRLLGYKRRYDRTDFPGFKIKHLFWFLIPIIFLRKVFRLRHKPLHPIVDKLFFRLSKLHCNIGTTILAVKDKVPPDLLKQHRTSIFIPIFNEEKILDRDIKAVDYIVKKIPVDYEIFIVNDASSDKSAIVAQKINQLNRKVELLNYTVGPTRRENLAQSFKNASGDIVAFVDIDLIASLRFFPDLIEQVVLGTDIVTGSRYLPNSKIKRKPVRLTISLIYNALIRLLFRTNIHDHMCGFKAFKKDVVIKLVEEMGYDITLQRGVFWDTELLIRARRHGYTIKEIPIWWRERSKSNLSFKREIRSGVYIIKFLLR